MAPDAGPVRGLQKASGLMDEGAIQEMCEAMEGTTDNLLRDVEKAAREKDIIEVDRLAEELKFLSAATIKICRRQSIPSRSRMVRAK
jgi:hypothetical protein